MSRVTGARGSESLLRDCRTSGRSGTRGEARRTALRVMLSRGREGASALDRNPGEPLRGGGVSSAREATAVSGRNAFFFSRAVTSVEAGRQENVASGFAP